MARQTVRAEKEIALVSHVSRFFHLEPKDCQRILFYIFIVHSPSGDEAKLGITLNRRFVRIQLSKCVF